MALCVRWTGLYLASLLIATPTSLRAQAPAEVTDLVWCASPQNDCLAWNPVSTADDYRLHVGDDRSVFCAVDARIDSCWTSTASDSIHTGSPLAANPPRGTFRWFLVTATNEWGEGSAGTNSWGPRVVDSSTACPDGAGTGLSCAQQSDCCGTAACVNGSCCQGSAQSCIANSNCCDSPCTAGICCRPGGAVCAQDSQCCTGLCGGGFCCSQSGSACGAGGCCPGNQCAGGICCAQIFASCTASSMCCQGTCDPASQRCCIPDGGSSALCTGCCSTICSAGICGRPCSTAGASCSPSGPPGFCCNGCNPVTRLCN